ncbi:MAG: ATP synthase F1 subunit epsilon [Thermoleophilia bacterium]|jgi:F-type H+-transporting ATPase subunit epsilon|nr:ATP synthase F1 subunit epsilon [Thermoleophilia bacterium]
MAEHPPIQVELVTPEGEVYKDAVTLVVLPGVEGELGIMAGHQPLVTLLAVGETRMQKADGTYDYVATGIGFAEVLFDRVLIVVDHAEEAGRIDIERAEVARRRAAERLRLRDDPEARAEVDLYRAEQALRRAENRLHVAQRRG